MADLNPPYRQDLELEVMDLVRLRNPLRSHVMLMCMRIIVNVLAMGHRGPPDMAAIADQMQTIVNAFIVQTRDQKARLVTELDMPSLATQSDVIAALIFRHKAELREVFGTGEEIRGAFAVIFSLIGDDVGGNPKLMADEAQRLADIYIEQLRDPSNEVTTRVVN